MIWMCQKVSLMALIFPPISVAEKNERKVVSSEGTQKDFSEILLLSSFSFVVKCTPAFVSGAVARGAWEICYDGD